MRLIAASPRTSFGDAKEESNSTSCPERPNKGEGDGQDTEGDGVDRNSLSGTEPFGEQIGGDFKDNVAKQGEVRIPSVSIVEDSFRKTYET